jgi:uncharacterized cupin superfamily protein
VGLGRGACLSDGGAEPAQAWFPPAGGVRLVDSATTDMLYVISGRCVLELDDGSKTEIGAGDVVVQSGTMHRWHNPFAEPCRVLGALVGARWAK